MATPVELQIRCTSCQTVVAWAEKLDDGSSGRWRLELLAECDHAAQRDARTWFYARGEERAALRLPLTIERPVG